MKKNLKNQKNQKTQICKTLALSAVVLTALVAAQPAAAQQTIKLGLTAALTGPFNEFGEGLRRGAMLAIEEWNRKGGINGRKIELAEALDDQLVPDRAVQNMRRILDNKDIVGVIAPAGSGPTLATIDMLEADGRPVCNALAQAPTIVYPKGTAQPPRKNVFSVAIGNEAEAGRLGQLLAKGFKNIGILHESTAYGTTGAEQVQKTVAGIDAKIKVTAEPYNQRSQDMTAQIARLQRANVDVVLVMGLGADFAVIRKNLSRLNINVPVYGTNGAATAPYIDGVGDLALGTHSVSTLTFGRRPLPDAAKRFVDAYRATHGTDRWYGPDAANPSISMASVVGTGYDCVNVLVDGMRRANSTEPAAVINAIEQTKNLPGAAIAEISFTPTRHTALRAEDLGLFVMGKRDGRVVLELAKD